MSLLMDALKKAELAKRQGHDDSAGAATDAALPGELTLQPLQELNAAEVPEDSPSIKNTRPAGKFPPLDSHLEEHLEEIDARFLAEAQQAASARLRMQTSLPPAVDTPAVQPAPAEAPPRMTAAEPPRRQAEQSLPQSKAAAQNLFAAKQVEKPPARKSFAIAVGALTVLSVCGIGGYFWWQLQPKNTLLAARAPLPAAASPAAAVNPAPAAVPAAPTVAASNNSAGAIRAAASAADEDEDVAVAPAKTSARVSTRARRAAALVEADSPVHVTRAPLKVDPALVRGFDAFNRGELALAQLEYERAQKADPRNTDALHGLAAIAVRQGRHEQADALYRRITEADPQDTVAMAALINNRAQIDPGAAESRLKSLAAAQPDLAAPHFSLGNLYSRHGRWSEAQQAYFKAYNAEPDNPDILYNLAVSLEHLRQNKLAAQYYNQALAAAENRPAGFDKALAAARLRLLQP
jgi:tetratricopeptide (TPR) repeat protein